ncbi:S1C family serine protease [Methylacidimicrobium sp. B4]|uniref:S1C family serine protease n=1 Tax=Methylacidimicrobium sp. B4 TaxID=2796139 RepID=UPI001A8CC5C8|nr:S1C family serine protease [Methylacidimicrobium sp. B4]QSR84320.1 serine protease [Methylacidimicrobium sp. B4]
MKPALTFKLSLSAVLLFWSSAISCLAWQESVATLGSEVSRVFGSARNGAVRVRVRHDSTETVGSGFFIDATGTVVTLSDLVSQGQEIRVESESGVLPAVLVGQDSRSGLALLRTQSSRATPFLRFASGTEMAPGSFVVGVGYPFNLSASPIVGVVLGADRQFQDRLFCVSHLRVDITVSPGELGAPLLNLQGLVVGVVSMVVNEGRWAYALPGKAATRVIGDMRQYGRVRYAWAGVGVARVGDDRTQSTVIVTRLFPNSAGKASGLQEGDRLERINGKPVHRLSDVVDASFYAPVGQPITVAVSRNGKIKRFSLLADERPPDNPGGAPGSPSVTLETSSTERAPGGPVEKTIGAGPN